MTQLLWIVVLGDFGRVVHESLHLTCENLGHGEVCHVKDRESMLDLLLSYNTASKENLLLKNLIALIIRLPECLFVHDFVHLVNLDESSSLDVNWSSDLAHSTVPLWVDFTKLCLLLELETLSKFRL